MPPIDMPSDANTQPAKPRALPRYRLWLHLYAMLLVVMIFALVAVGGNVTSLDAGMAVPEGWTTFDYFTPFAPLEVWWHDQGTRWEHSHRLVGMLVGFLTIGLVISLFVTQFRSRPWLAWLGLLLLLMVIVQGVMGAERVDRISTELALVHGVFGQIVLGATVLIAAATSRVWIHLAGRSNRTEVADWVRVMALVFIGVLLVQLTLGATVRHWHATIAIPDFPGHYGKLFPPMTQPEIDAAIAAMPEDMATTHTTVKQVVAHFLHRVVALGVVAVAGVLVLGVVGKLPGRREVIGPVFLVVALLVLQIYLGISVVLSGGAPSTATFHQACGAALLAAAVWLAIRIHLVTASRRNRVKGSGRVYVAPGYQRGLA